MPHWKPKSIACGLVTVLACDVLLLALVWTSLAAEQRSGSQSPTDLVAPCPRATPEPLWVEPVPAHTDQLTQIVVVFLGNGEAVTVTAESGVFGVQGDFDAYAHPAIVEIALRPHLTHHLTVYGRVKRVVVGECVYGGYTLSTTRDRYGAALVIRQQEGKGAVRYLPIVYK